MTPGNRFRLRYVAYLTVTLSALLALASATTSAGSPVTQDGTSAVFDAATSPGPVLSYQGRLVNRSTGNPENGTFPMTFKLYDVSSGGKALSTESEPSVQVTNGLFSTLLGDGGLDLTAFDGRDLWLGVQVGSDVEATPRIQIAYAPYALYATTVNASNIITGTLNSARFSAYSDLLNETKIGVGRDQVARGDHLHDDRYYTQVDTNALFVNDNAGEVDNADVLDQALAPEKIAGTASVVGHSHYGATWVGSLPDVTGLVVQNRGTGDGIRAHSGSNEYSAGVKGTSPSGYGVYGDGYIGMYGVTVAQDGRGVIGYAGGGQPSQIAVEGIAESPGALAGSFIGSVQVIGDLTATGVKPFRIDHPLDPANKYLYHFAVEAPEVRNQYEGMVVLDANGEATVSLPDYFEALNLEGSYRYQLTCVGGYAPVYIAQEISGNLFVIGGGKQGLKVSWQVTAVRNDPYLRDHPVQAEIAKSAEDAGNYQYPEGYGQPASKGQNHERIPPVEVGGTAEQ